MKRLRPLSLQAFIRSAACPRSLTETAAPVPSIFTDVSAITGTRTYKSHSDTEGIKKILLFLLIHCVINQFGQFFLCARLYLLQLDREFQLPSMDPSLRPLHVRCRTWVHYEPTEA